MRSDEEIVLDAINAIASELLLHSSMLNINLFFYSLVDEPMEHDEDSL